MCPPRRPRQLNREASPARERGDVDGEAASSSAGAISSFDGSADVDSASSAASSEWWSRGADVVRVVVDDAVPAAAPSPPVSPWTSGQPSPRQGP